jgi:6-phosphofructokinase
MIGIDPLAAIISGISAIQNLRLGNIAEKALLEEVLEEVASNLKTIKEDYIKNEVPIEKIIHVLKISKLESAEKKRKRKKLDFNKIKPGKINRDCFVSKYQFKQYGDFDTEKVLLKLREKISDFKKARRLYFSRNKWSKKINPKSRMNTIEQLYILFSNHLSSK